ncbi:MAG: toll/interleukin-1 receptor domain-containing protein [Dehalococcoidia bacterium]
MESMDAQVSRGPTLVVGNGRLVRGQVHVPIFAEGHSFEPYMGFNVHLRWDPLIFTFAGAHTDGGLFDASNGAAFAPPPDTATFDSDGGGVVIGCVSLVGSKDVRGLLATIVLAPVAEHGCSFLHLFTFGGIDGGNESTGTYTVAADGAQAQYSECIDSSSDVAGRRCADTGLRRPEIVHTAADYYSCFLSFGAPDLEFATRLYGDLKARKVACWLYNIDQTPGERTWREIGQRRRGAGRMLVVCSVASLTRPGVLRELEQQIDEDPEKIVPLSLDNEWRRSEFEVIRAGNDLKSQLTDRNLADFAGLGYAAALEQLLRALRKSTP